MHTLRAPVWAHPFLLALPLVLSCGGAKPVTAPTSPGGASSSTSAAGAHALLDAIDPQAQMAVHVDVTRLREAPFFQAVMATVHQMGADRALEAANKQCGFPLPESVSEVVVSGGKESLVAAAALSVPGDKMLACIRTLTQASDAQLDDGTPALRLGEGDKPAFVLVKDGVLYMGDPATLKRAMGAKGAASPLLSHLGLSGDTVVAGYGEINDGPVQTVSGTLKASDKEFWIDLVVETTSPEVAARFAQMAQAGIPQQQGGGGLGLEHALTAEGKTLKVHLGTEGPPEQQIQTVGTLSALAIAGVRRYIERAKSAEATNATHQIAKDLEASVEEAKAAHKPVRFPPSAPPVPAEIPRGKKYQSNTGDWSGTWKTIRFSMDMPQYFRYAIVTAPDKKHATVRAEGDLDGDGKASLYEVPLEIDAKGGVVEGKLKVTDEP